MAPAGAHAETTPSPDISDPAARASYRFEFHNDFFFRSDKSISGAMTLQKQTAPSSSWETLQGLPGFLQRWGSRFPTLTGEGLSYGMGLALGQVVQTPSELSHTEVLEEDVPYAGALALSSSWYAFSDSEFRGFELLAGVTGPASLAEVSQKSSHRLLGIGQPHGWENQLDSELLLNANYMRKWKVWRHGSAPGNTFDAALSGNTNAGNMFTQASIGTELRYGRNLPAGFSYVPAPIGFGMHYKAMLAPPDPRQPSLYGSLVLRATAVAHNIFLDGNSFQRSHSVGKEPLYGQAIIGLNYETREWSVYASVNLSTDTVDTTKATEAQGDGALGSIAFEWRI